MTTKSTTKTPKKLKFAEIRALKLKAEKTYERYTKLWSQLKDSCYCPDSFMVTRCHYITDTLGNNGENYYQDYCSVCNQSQGAEYTGRDCNDQPNFAVEKE
jgi:hypothetical protein